MGFGTVVSLIARIVDNLIPSKKAALVAELNALTVKYNEALNSGRDTDAAMIRKQMAELRKKAGYTNGEI